jgi:hypothetical protein
MENFRLNRAKLQVSQMGVEEDSSTYWRTYSSEKTLEAIQFLRIQFHPELNDSSTRLQQVYRAPQLSKLNFLL